jgi:hypothetical protein
MDRCASNASKRHDSVTTSKGRGRAPQIVFRAREVVVVQDHAAILSLHKEFLSHCLDNTSLGHCRGGGQSKKGGIFAPRSCALKIGSHWATAGEYATFIVDIRGQQVFKDAEVGLGREPWRPLRSEEVQLRKPLFFLEFPSLYMRSEAQGNQPQRIDRPNYKFDVAPV